MPSIFKRFTKPKADAYVFPDASQWDDVKNVIPPGSEDEEEGEEPFEVFQPEVADSSAAKSADEEDFTDFHTYNNPPEEAPPVEEQPPEEQEAPPPEPEKAEEEAPAPEEPETEAETGAPHDDPAAPPRKRRSTPVDYARVQAEAILSQARDEAEAIKEAALREADEEIKKLKEQAKAEGFQAGHDEGFAQGIAEGHEEIEKQAVELGSVVGDFLDTATKMRDQLLDQTREELRDLAMTIAEKVIRISLRSSGDVLMRMIETATEKHKKCEWVQIYIADCDARNISLSTPELTASLGHLSDRVRIIPMMDDESGTCIIEMPDEIIDASVSTQLENIREIMSTTVSDRE